MDTTGPALPRQLELSYLLGRFITDHLVRVHQRFDGDLTAAIVLATIAQHNLQRFYDEVARRSERGMDGLLRSGEHVPHLRLCNTLSVSAATGIPRETVRRKVLALRRRGWVEADARGRLAVSPDVAGAFHAFDAETIARFERSAREILGVLDMPTDE